MFWLLSCMYLSLRLGCMAETRLSAMFLSCSISLSSWAMATSRSCFSANNASTSRASESFCTLSSRASSSTSASSVSVFSLSTRRL